MFDFQFRLEHAVDHHNEHVKVFVNDVPVGRMKIKDKRLAFRSVFSPYTNLVPNIPSYYLSEPLKLLAVNRHVLNNLLPIALRVYARNAWRYTAPEIDEPITYFDAEDDLADALCEDLDVELTQMSDEDLFEFEDQTASDVFAKLQELHAQRQA